MYEVFFSTLTPMLIMFTCILAGFIMKKANILPDNASSVLSKLETALLVPALSCVTFMNHCTVQSLSANIDLIFYALISLFAGIFIALPLSKLFVKEGYQRNIYKYALTFGNFGFMGNSIVPLIFGEPELYRYMLFTLPLSITVNTWGLLLLVPSNEKKTSVIRRLFNPTTMGVLIGIVLGITGATKILPVFVKNTLGNISACMGPIAMIITGIIIGEYKISQLLKNTKVYVATFLRLIVLPAVIITILHLCKANTTVTSLALIAYATPLGLNTVVFPSSHGKDTSTGASMAMISHTLSVITIPIMYFLFTYILK